TLQHHALVAQLDRVLGYEPSGRRFESSRVRQIKSPVHATGLFHFTGRIAGHPEQPRVAFAGAHSWVHTHSRAFSEPWPMLDCPPVLSPCRQTPPGGSRLRLFRPAPRINREKASGFSRLFSTACWTYSGQTVHRTHPSSEVIGRVFIDVQRRETRRGWRVS